VFYLQSSVTEPQTPGLLHLTNVAPNSTGRLHIWVNSDVRLAGVSLDIVETGGAIKFTGPADIPIPIGPPSRWAFLDGPHVVTDSSVTSIGAAAIPGVNGDGIGAGSTAGPNVLIASVPYMALASGTSQLQLRVGANGIADYNTGDFAPVRFGTLGGPFVNGDAFGMGSAVGSIQVGGGLTPVITPIDLGEVSEMTRITANLVVGGVAVWSNLMPLAGSPAIPATLDANGAFSWDPTGSKRGPKGNGALYSWSATATSPAGSTTSVALTLRLIPEPATLAMMALSAICLVSSFRSPLLPKRN
jgi:hypothetical protein